MKSTLAFASLLAAAQATTYTVKDTFDRTNFFNSESFTFFDEADPTNGFVDYVDSTTASSAGLAGYMNNMVYLGVDYRTANPTGGRRSTRISSTNTYDKGLFIADITHMPVGCGVWPAFWTFGPNWPSSGEIDIIEGVNSQATDAVTLHTSAGCTMTKTGSQSDTVFSTGESSVDCGADGGSTGCSLATTDTNAYGAGFNANGGGVYAMELSSDAISVWFFARNSTMATNLAVGGSAAAAPNTADFGTPVARFSGCDIDSHFKQQQIIFDTTFCGDWAGQQSIWSSDATCAPKADTCNDYILNNGADLVDAYWLINSVRVYDASSSYKRDGAHVAPFSARRSASIPKREGLVPQPFMA
ncbi:glycoside hydrolase family 16 protein [Ophiostoma piceae UAMH 11346]|uniref:endo-1,3(4)-beta-glucanase n=1 Tax=Ophiostoma piceae (strain UAMH 11346) TaxID=1262450 RepID=S3BYJ3_OPHP1|nr:glycoside hydrolase family 16 protein [Ophiostoma piceae UAMH 11346]